MELQLESPVASADGIDLGKIHRIIFDPRSAEVTSIVLKKGVFFARDVAIPIEDVHAATAERVELSLSGQDVDKPTVEQLGQGHAKSARAERLDNPELAVENGLT